jgi:hypothetical protein
VSVGGSDSALIFSVAECAAPREKNVISFLFSLAGKNCRSFRRERNGVGLEKQRKNKYGNHGFHTCLNNFDLGGVVVSGAKTIKLLVLLQRVQIKNRKVDKLYGVKCEQKNVSRVAKVGMERFSGSNARRRPVP